MAVKTITMKGNAHVIRKEGIVITAAITPGMLVARAATGIVRHATAAANAARAFAVENEVVGDGIDDDYAVADTILFGIFPSGAEVYAFCSGSIAIGEFVESNGAGGVRVAATRAATTEAESASVVGVALAANVSTRCHIEVL
jgi:hypothetical protein